MEMCIRDRTPHAESSSMYARRLMIPSVPCSARSLSSCSVLNLSLIHICVEVEQGGPWGYRHQFNVADSGFGLRAPRLWNDRAGEVGRCLLYTSIVDVLGENVVEIHRNAYGNIYYLPSWQSLCGERRGWLVVTEISELAGDTWIEDTEAALNKWRNNYSCLLYTSRCV